MKGQVNLLNRPASLVAVSPFQGSQSVSIVHFPYPLEPNVAAGLPGASTHGRGGALGAPPPEAL